MDDSAFCGGVRVLHKLPKGKRQPPYLLFLPLSTDAKKETTRCTGAGEESTRCFAHLSIHVNRLLATQSCVFISQALGQRSPPRGLCVFSNPKSGRKILVRCFLTFLLPRYFFRRTRVAILHFLGRHRSQLGRRAPLRSWQTQKR